MCEEGLLSYVLCYVDDVDFMCTLKNFSDWLCFFFFRVCVVVAVRMYGNVGSQPGVQQSQTSLPPNPFGSAFNVAGSGLIRGGLGAYGGKILGSSSEYVQSNVRLSSIAKFLPNDLIFRMVHDILD